MRHESLAYVERLDEHGKFYDRVLGAQKAAWGVAALMLLAAAWGVFGGAGPFTHRVTRQDGLRVEHPRFARMDAATSMKVSYRPPGTDSKLVLWIERDLLDKLRLTQVTPAPVRQQGDETGVLYEFPCAGPSREVLVRFDFEPVTWGPVEGEVGIAGGPRIRVHYYTYP